jgi:serine/threonine-protein kinase
MPLPIGTRLGAYEILGHIGSGGMGEVYRARDTKLNRDVALKILPEAFATDADRLARFKREAQVLASLNHPNIAAIYGFEDSGETHALVLELVEGPTLADRIAKGAAPLDEALPIARQIAEALEAAHEQGIIHRDLKPANVKVRDDGTVKVLDFGLAKALDPVALSVDATTSPTLSIHATQAGFILGTASYMAPEQARGRAVDRRADIWAFGCVLFEMLTGRRAFDGDDVSTMLAAVLKTDPDWQLLPPAAPPGLRRLLVRCLNKDPKDRWQAIGDVRIEIRDLLSGAPETSTTASTTPLGSPWRHVMSLAAVALLAATVTGAIVWFAARSTVAQPRVSRLHITPSSTAALSFNGVGRDVAITPDGSRIVYIGANGTTLFVRPLDRLEPISLTRGEAIRDLFISPDGQWIGFFDGPQTLKKVAMSGGPAVLVAPLDANERGATWAPDGTIIFATISPTSGLQRISADGGEAAVLTRPDRARGEAGHQWPEVLPGGRAVLYTVAAVTGGLDAASIAVLDVRSGRSTMVLRGGSDAHYSPSGQIVYEAAGTLRAIGFDATRLSVVGPSGSLVPDVLTSPLGAIEAGIARDGTLVYVTGGTGSLARTLVWVDRQGRETPTGAPRHLYLYPRISPDATRVAVSVFDRGNYNISVWESAGPMLRPITSESAVSVDSSPVWTPDGRRIVFTSSRAGAQNLFSQATDGTGTVERLAESPNSQASTAISRDGTLLFTEWFPKTGADVMALRLGGPHQVLPLVQTRFNERNGMVSPDGRWLAYEADDSGAFEIHVRPYPDVNRGHWQISTSGGTQPVWGPQGQELFYVAPDGALMRVGVSAGAAWTAGAATKVIESRYVTSTTGLYQRNFDIAPDGQRFLMLKAANVDANTAPPQIVIVQHFDEELKRLVPVK